MALTMEEITQTIRSYVRSHIMEDAVKNHEELSVYGLNSLKTIQLLVEIETFYNITFDDEDLITENFTTIEKIVTHTWNKLMIGGKQSS